MALFEKKFCDLCGEKVNLLTRQKLSDGFLCSDCKKKLSSFSSDWDDRTIEDVKAHLAAREQNKQKFASVSATRTVGPNGEICVDDRNGKFYFAYGKDYKENNPEVFDFNQLLDFWFVEEYRTLTDSDNDGVADKYENNNTAGNTNNFGRPGMMNGGMMNPGMMNPGMMNPGMMGGMMNGGMMGGMMNGMVQIPQNLQQYFRRTQSTSMNDNSPRELSSIELHIKVNHAYIKRDIIFDVASNCSDPSDLNRAFNMCYEIVQALTAIKGGNTVNNNNGYQQQNNGYQQMNNGYAQQNNGYQQMNNGYAQQNNGYQQMNNGYAQQNNGYQQMNNGYAQQNNGYQQMNNGYAQQNNGYQQMNNGYAQQNNGYQQMNNNGYQQANNMNANMGGIRPFCPNCGAQNTTGSVFCPNCGTNLKQ